MQTFPRTLSAYSKTGGE